MHKLNFRKCENCEAEQFGLKFENNKLIKIGSCKCCNSLNFGDIFLNINPVKHRNKLLIPLYELEDFLNESDRDDDEWEISISDISESHSNPLREFKGW